MSRAYCCEVDDAPDPRWHIERWGDAVVTWACDAHLAEVCERRKLRERADRARAGLGDGHG